MRMMKWLSRKKLNNKGMTLVEIVVAVAVFTVVAVPVMQIFSSSSGTNFRSRERQRATLVGEAIMESFKAFDMEAIVTQVQNNSYNGVKLIGAAPTVVASVGGSEISEVLLADGKLRRDADYFKFTFEDVEADGMVVDVEVVATPSVEGQYMRMESPSAYSDAIYTLGHSFNNDLSATNVDKAKAALVAAKPAVALSDVTDVTTKDFKRITTFTVSDSDGVQKVTMKMSCTANATVKYKESNGAGGKVDKEETLPVSYDVEFKLEDDTFTDEIVIYDNTNTIAGEYNKGDACKLDNVYYYFSPAYDCFFGDNASEEFVIEGNLTSQYDASGASVDAESIGRLPLKICLVKQKYTGIDETLLNLEEMKYSAKVTSNLTGGGEVTLAHNFNENLVGPSGSVLAPVPTTGFTEVQTYSNDPTDTYECAFAGEVELLYDLTINVSEDAKGTTKNIAYFEGTAVN